MAGVEGATALVTGAGGFLGANLVRALLARHAEVHALVRPGAATDRLAELDGRLRVWRAELGADDAVEAVVAAVRPSFVFHLAARGGHPADRDARLAALRTDVLGTAQLLEALAAHPCRRVVHVGSSLEYGPRSEPLHEEMALAPTTFRGAGKAAAAQVALGHARATGAPLVLLRPFSVYGPWEQPGRLVPTLLRAALGDGRVDLTAPCVRRDLVYVEDVAEACLLACAAPDAVGQAINVGSGRQWSNEEVAAAVERVTGRRLEIRTGRHPASPADTAHWVADPARAARLLGWSARHSLADGLARTLAWLRAPRARSDAA
jgi:nucleoside-diphosphate-sugar epimerase